MFSTFCFMVPRPLGPLGPLVQGPWGPWDPYLILFGPIFYLCLAIFKTCFCIVLPIELPIELPIVLPIVLPIELPIELPIGLHIGLHIGLPIGWRTLAQHGQRHPRHWRSMQLQPCLAVERGVQTRAQLRGGGR